MPEQFLDFIYQITSPELQRRLLGFKILSILIFTGMVAAIVYFLRHSRWWELTFPHHSLQALGFRGREERKIVKEWKKIQRRLEQESMPEAKLAIIEADQLLGRVLERMGYRGETVEQRLSQVSVQVLENLGELKKVRKIRDNIVHDPDYQLELDQASEVIEVYQQVLEALEIL